MDKKKYLWEVFAASGSVTDYLAYAAAKHETESLYNDNY